MHKHFIAAREEKPGEDWLARFVAGRDAAASWYLGQGLEEPSTAAECRSALRQHMPELIRRYDEACALVGDDDLAHRILSHYRPPPLISGCTQVIWLGRGGPALVRNYDYPLDLVTGRIESSAWFGHEVIAKTQRPWGGLTDGMNEHGLVASLTFGGREVQGRGFSIILMLRYVLETCRRVDEAIKALSRIPIAVSQNVTLLDRSGDYAILFLGPDREPAISRIKVCTNHQETPGIVADSVERQEIVLAALADPGMSLNTLARLFLTSPLYSWRAASTTAYTAVYRPAEGRVDYIWPGKVWPQSMGRFTPGEYVHDYGELLP